MSAPLGSLQQKVIDIMSLTGDAADNVPGCPGIGPKTAANLINLWGSLDALIISVITGYTNKILTPRIAQLISDNMTQIRMSKELVRLDYGRMRTPW